MAETEIRLVVDGDIPALQEFLATRPSTTMFLRSNLERVGLQDHGRAYEGTWAAAFRGSEVVGVAAHFWTGRLILECPDSLEPVVRCAVAASPRPLSGVLGPWEQAVAARRALAAENQPTRLESREALFALELDALRVPPALEKKTVRGRTPTSQEVESILTGWRVQFVVESLGADPTDDEYQNAGERLRREAAEGSLWVLEVEGELVAMTGFNARLADCVQIGGVFTPPSLRGRGYARCAVAASLISARTEGVERSILFTGDDNTAAQRCYQALGYELIGDYAIIHFRE